jgi:hypothetical protein
MLVHPLTNASPMRDPVVLPAVRRVALHRRVALIGPDRVEIRPARRALVVPLVGFAVGVAAFLAIALGRGALPLGLLVLLLCVAVLAIPLAGLGLVYALIGAHVVVDRARGSATWQQGVIGLGIGTQELVPFAKIAAITVEEAGAAPEGTGSPTEELAQWQIVLDKTSGRRLVVGGVTAARPLAAAARARAEEVARAIAALTGAPLRLPAAAAPDEGARPPQPHRAAGRPPAPSRRRARQRGR